MQRIKHGMLRADVYNEIKTKILEQKFPPGKSLTENWLCELLGVSRTPVREALAQLESDGLVESVPNKGVVVLGISIQDINDMYEIRQCIEGTAVKKACMNISSEGLKSLKSILEREKEHVQTGDFEGYQNSDYEFHDEIIRSSGSRIFQNVLLLMMEKTRIARKSSLATGRRIVDSLEEHYAIYDALHAKDPEGSYEKMVRHIINAKECYIKTIIEKGIAYE